MTINTINRIVEERRFPTPPPDATESKPRLYPAPDYPFRGWQPPQLEGYRQSVATPAESAIILDNGLSCYNCSGEKPLIMFCS